MSDSASRQPARPSLEQFRKQARELLQQYRAGEETARNRFAAADSRRSRPVRLADAQFVLARENGFETWANLKRHLEDRWRSRFEGYQRLAEDIHRVCKSRDTGATERVRELFGGKFTAEQLRSQVLQRLEALPGGLTDSGSVTLADARRFVASLYSFESWTGFEESFAHPPVGPSAHGFSATPPFYKIDRKENSLRPRPPLSARDWDEIFEVMQHHRITGLRASGQMTDTVLERLAELDLVTSLHLDGSQRVTDAGLRHLARLQRLERLDLSGCGITDQGLRVLRHLPQLREFHMHHHAGISDEGLANLALCERLERVDLLGSNTGDGVIRALTGKPNLRHFKSGNNVSDAGLSLLHDFPVFKTWQGGNPDFSLMGFEAEPTYLLLRGGITDNGMRALAGLDGLFALNLDDSSLSITASGLRPLAQLPHLGWLGFDATDETMSAIAALPRLRMLMCQDTRASDAGFIALSRSRMLEYIWGRRCYNLTGSGFAAMARMPALRGLSVSCRNVDDASLSTLPGFPSLVEFMPMDVSDEGFVHVGRCERLQALWCMYCHETGDAATAHLAGLQHLKSYYAGQTRITDRSLEILGRMQTLERLTFRACANISNSGVAALAALPNLRELSIQGMPAVTRTVLASFPAHLSVDIGN